MMMTVMTMMMVVMITKMTVNSLLPLSVLAARVVQGSGRRTMIVRESSLESTWGQVELRQTSPSISDTLHPFLLLQKTDWAGPPGPTPPTLEAQWSTVRNSAHNSSPSP